MENDSLSFKAVSTHENVHIMSGKTVDALAKIFLQHLGDDIFFISENIYIINTLKLFGYNF